jgi:hypothetical protein
MSWSKVAKKARLVKVLLSQQNFLRPQQTVNQIFPKNPENDPVGVEIEDGADHSNAKS